MQDYSVLSARFYRMSCHVFTDLRYVINTRSRVVHTVRTALARISPQLWVTRCGWKFALADFDFVDRVSPCVPCGV
eukprot:4190433-Amphidinium_carterae.1